MISTNESYRRVALARGHVAPERTTVVRSAPDLTRFVPVAPDDALRRGRRFLVCYLGVMGPQDGVDYALRALASLRDDLGRHDVQAAFVGRGDAWDDLVALAHELGLDDCVEFTGRVSDADVARYLSTADVCLAPDPKNPLNDVSTMNKIVEYMAMSRPLVSFDLIEARVSAGDAAVYATPNDEREFARLIVRAARRSRAPRAHGRARPAARRAGAVVGALAPQPARGLRDAAGARRGAAQRRAQAALTRPAGFLPAARSAGSIDATWEVAPARRRFGARLRGQTPFAWPPGSRRA